MEEKRAIAPCGIICDDCQEYKNSCAGCRSIGGRPTWLPYVEKEICPLYDCPVNAHSYQTCGECDELPCEKFMELRDPAQSDGEFEKSIRDRLTTLRRKV